MAHCTSCGEPLHEGQRFCGHCGAPRQAVPTGEPAVTRTTNTLAVASLIVGLLWFGGLGSILAIVFSTKAKREIEASRGMQGGEGYATAGIVLGWVGIVLPVIALLGLCAVWNGGSGGVSVSGPERAGFVLDVTSELESAANAQERVFDETGTYTSDINKLQFDEYVGVESTLVSVGDAGFCFEATHDDLRQTWYITENADRPRRGSCP